MGLIRALPSCCFHEAIKLYVARFVGVENILAGRIGGTRDNLVAIFLGGQALQAIKPAGSLGPDVQVCIRAEAVTLYPQGGARPPETAINRFLARVTAARNLGPLATVELAGEYPLKAYALVRQAREMELVPGQTVGVEIPVEAVHLMPD